ncbi:MAG: cell wall hydrolase [Clostridia bacterium]|nr:cell wall hydrolase [Clostridia bacterium]
MKKIVLALCLCLALIMPFQTVTHAIYNDTTAPLDLVINDTYVRPSQPLIMYQNTVYIAGRSLCELFGATDFSWNSGTFTVNYGTNHAKITAGQSYFTVNGTTYDLPKPAAVVNSRIYVPVRFAQKTFNVSVEWNQGYCNVVLKKSGHTVPAKYVSDYQADHILWLARIVQAESGNEPDAGKLGVANVILNRVNSSQYPNTIYGVIFDDKYGVQYTPSVDGTIYNTPSYASVMAAKRALHGENNVGGCLFFANPNQGSWVARNRTFYTQIGNHAFYL